MRYGDLGKRFVAYLIDSVILTLLTWFVNWILSAMGIATFNASMFTSFNPFQLIVTIFNVLLVSLIIQTVIQAFYWIGFEGSSLHATPGKLMMGLYVTDEQGIGVGFGAACVRWLGKKIDNLTLGIGYLICFFNPEKQCLHDLLAKTYVLEGKADESGAYDEVYPGAPQVVCVCGPMSGCAYAVSEDGVAIGRDARSCQVVVPAALAQIGRVHCLVTYNPVSQMFVLSDRNSTNGTFLENGQRVDAAHPIALRSGSRFYLATPELSFEVR